MHCHWTNIQNTISSGYIIYV